jgi:FtsH-binding integral membrane protein
MKKNSKNPFLTGVAASINEGTEVATKVGIYSKTLLGVVVFVASLLITITNESLLALSTNLFVVIIAIIALVAITFKVVSNPKSAGIYAIAYAVLEGFLLSALAATAIVVTKQPAVILYVLAMIVCIFIFMYALRAILPRSVSKGLSNMVSAALVAFVGITFVLMIGSLFFGGMSETTYLIISIVGAVIASFMFIRDFENVDNLVENKVGKEYEWMCALGILSTVIMLFVYLLRIIISIALRND